MTIAIAGLVGAAMALLGATLYLGHVARGYLRVMEGMRSDGLREIKATAARMEARLPAQAPSADVAEEDDTDKDRPRRLGFWSY